MASNKPYPKEQIEWLREFYPTHSLVETQKEFNEHFGLNLSISSIKHRLRKNGIKNNKKTQFSKNNNPWNKGVSVRTERPDIYAKYFLRNTKYEAHGAVYRLPVGTISHKKDKNWIKIADPDVWTPYARYVWEKETGEKLTAKDKIVHLDGNLYNDDISNLYKTTNSVLIRLNRKHFTYENADISKAAIMSQTLLQMIKEIENEKTTPS